MHEIYMQHAIQLAKKGYVSPNPRVGAVLVRDQQILAEGFHQKFGEAHAEAALFNSLPKDYDYSNTTLYVSLEPCSHHGKTPPCADRIIELGIPNVVIACLDPNPLVAGNGVAKLKNAGINVLVGVCESEAIQLNEAFFKFITTKKPFVVVKCGISLDGKICTNNGESKWITSEESRNEVHELRSQLTAIMVGANTVCKDNPALTSRLPHGRNPIRIVIDTNLKTSLNAQLIQTAHEIPTIIVTSNTDESHQKHYLDLGVQLIICSKNQNGQINLRDAFEKLAQRNIDSILIEGGGELIFSALDEHLVDKLYLYIAPIIIGGTLSKSFVSGNGINSLKDAFQIEHYNVRQLSRDLVIEAYIKK